MATQSLYPNVIIWIRHTPSVVEAKVCCHGVWRFDLIEKAGLSRQASGFMKLICTKPPWLHIMVIKCMTVFSFCPNLLLRVILKACGQDLLYVFSTEVLNANTTWKNFTPVPGISLSFFSLYCLRHKTLYYAIFTISQENTTLLYL